MKRKNRSRLKRRDRGARKARDFYRMRTRDVLPPDEAEATRPWRGCGFALLAFLAAAALGCCAAWFVFK